MRKDLQAAIVCIGLLLCGCQSEPVFLPESLFDTDAERHRVLANLERQRIIANLERQRIIANLERQREAGYKAGLAGELGVVPRPLSCAGENAWRQAWRRGRQDGGHWVP